MKRLFFILLVVISSVTFMFGCGLRHPNNINITEIETYPKPLFEPLKIKVGAYYGNEFRTFDTLQQFNAPGSDLTEICKIQIGKANIALFDYILAVVYQKVTPVKYLPKGSDRIKNIDLIVEPTVHSYTLPNPTADGVYIHITYTIIFYLPDGEKINSWTIIGIGHAPLKFEFKSQTSHVTELTQMAMRQVAAKFMTDFCNQNEIKKLFYSQCNP